MHIVKHRLGSGIVRQRLSDGYINATDICQIAGKNFSSWNRTQTAKDLVQALSFDVQITTSLLVYSKKSGVGRGTYIHPDLAVPLAMWASPEFAITVSRWVKNWFLSCVEEDQTESYLSIDDAIKLSEIVVDTLSMVSEPVRAMLKLETIGSLRPDIKPALLKPIKAIASANPLPDVTHTPTEIGVMVAQKLGVDKVSAIAINKKLVELGYQESIKRINSKQKEVHHYYQPTDTGKEFGQIELAAFKAGEANTTKPNTRWYAGAVDVLVEKWEYVKYSE